mmetsp:Transcript_10915/g.20547  ORF Transcript_10915/g.20547 Transcript_10915/m.20547 type:complete len:356 (-) Transcript_10915:1715-2782(-)
MSRASTPLNDPRYDSRWKMPGYTGHVNGVVETLGSTPVTAQRKAFYRNGTEMDPTSVDFVPMPGRDPCNKDSGTMKRTVPELLWPQVADGGGGAVRKGENGSSLILGDSRFVQKFTHYKDTHVHPYLQGSLWHPAPNVRDHTHNLAMMTPEERVACYEKMLDKVGEVSLQHIEDNLRLRFAAKLNTASNANGFKLLKLFQNFDTQCTGTIEIHDFRKALHSYGLQLPTEMEICMFAKFDVDGNGTLDYKQFVSHYVEGEYLDLGFSSLKDAEIRQADLSKEDQMRLEHIKKLLLDRFRQLTGTNAASHVKEVFRAMDEVRICFNLEHDDCWIQLEVRRCLCCSLTTKPFSFYCVR